MAISTYSTDCHDRGIAYNFLSPMAADVADISLLALLHAISSWPFVYIEDE